MRARGLGALIAGATAAGCGVIVGLSGEYQQAPGASADATGPAGPDARPPVVDPPPSEAGVDAGPPPACATTFVCQAAFYCDTFSDGGIAPGWTKNQPKIDASIDPAFGCPPGSLVVEGAGQNWLYYDLGSAAGATLDVDLRVEASSGTVYLAQLAVHFDFFAIVAFAGDRVFFVEAASTATRHLENARVVSGAWFHAHLDLDLAKKQASLAVNGLPVLDRAPVALPALDPKMTAWVGVETASAVAKAHADNVVLQIR